MVFIYNLSELLILITTVGNYYLQFKPVRFGEPDKTVYWQNPECMTFKVHIVTESFRVTNKPFPVTNGHVV